MELEILGSSEPTDGPEDVAGSLASTADCTSALTTVLIAVTTSSTVKVEPDPTPWAGGSAEPELTEVGKSSGSDVEVVVAVEALDTEDIC